MSDTRLFQSANQKQIQNTKRSAAKESLSLANASIPASIIKGIKAKAYKTLHINRENPLDAAIKQLTYDRQLFLQYPQVLNHQPFTAVSIDCDCMNVQLEKMLPLIGSPIKELTLQGTMHPANCLALFTQLKENNIALRSLVLSNTGSPEYASIDEQAIGALCALVSRPLTCLRSLSLIGQQLTDQHFLHLLRAISFLKCPIEEVYLDHNQLTDTSIKQLTQIISDGCLPQLRILSLSDNTFSKCAHIDLAVALLTRDAPIRYHKSINRFVPLSASQYDEVASQTVALTTGVTRGGLFSNGSDIKAKKDLGEKRMAPVLKV